MTTDHDGTMRVEHEIDAALKMLGEMQPAADLVSRVHRSLDAAAASHQDRSSRRFLIPAAGVAMAAVVLAAIFTPIHPTRETRASAVETAKLVATSPKALTALAPPVAKIATKSSSEIERSVQFSAERRSHPNRENRHAVNLLSYPLTRQERLLVRFVQTAKPADLQALNPEYQAKVEAQQDAEFEAYLKSGSPDTERNTQTTESTQE